MQIERETIITLACGEGLAHDEAERYADACIHEFNLSPCRTETFYLGEIEFTLWKIVVH